MSGREPEGFTQVVKLFNVLVVWKNQWGWVGLRVKFHRWMTAEKDWGIWLFLN